MLFGLIFVVSALAGTAVWFLVGPASSVPAGRGAPDSVETAEGGGDAAARRGRFKVFDAEALRRAQRR